MPANRLGDQTFVFKSQPRIIGGYTVVGPDEGKGPLSEYFDMVINDYMHGETIAERAERSFLKDAISGLFGNLRLTAQDIDLYIGGDLLNQIVSTAFNVRDFGFPYIGLYNACATFGEALVVGSMVVDGGYGDTVMIGVSSHYQTAERQFRYPIEVNNQRKETNQYTVSGAGAAVISHGELGPRITMATIGSIADYGLKDANDMGCAMAPAAAATLKQHFDDTSQKSSDYDLILTGDLSTYGSQALARIALEKYGIELGDNYKDGGCMMFNSDQNAKAGGSGCACSATVTLGHVVKEMAKGTYKRVLVVPTGALHSQLSIQQGDSIPCIAHAVALEA